MKQRRLEVSQIHQTRTGVAASDAIRYLGGRDYVLSVQSVIEQWQASCFQQRSLQHVSLRLVAMGRLEQLADPQHPTVSSLMPDDRYDRIQSINLMTVTQPERQRAAIRFALPETPLSDQHLFLGLGKWILELEMQCTTGQQDLQLLPVPQHPNMTQSASLAG